jgi:MurNAc alpha-1-phosphate uridylyltransferase
MKAMILAAGRGERMRPLTDHTPKPLLSVADKPLIVHLINQLVSTGITQIVINHAHLGQQIEDFLGNGQHYGAEIVYSPEGSALETAGGIIKALPLLGHEPFLVVNGDIWTDFNFATLTKVNVNLAHLVLIDNPVHHPQGDFCLTTNGQLSNADNNRLTFSGIGIYSPELFADLPTGIVKLAPILRQAIDANRVTGGHFKGFWMDIGTPERLAELDQYLRRIAY